MSREEYCTGFKFIVAVLTSRPMRMVHAYNVLATAAHKTVPPIRAANHLQPVPSFIIKVLEVYEMYLVRHGFMVVGLPFAGKTSCYRVLAEAQTLLNAMGIPPPSSQR